MEYIQSINANEKQKANDDRLMKGEFTTKDYLDYGIIKLKPGSDEEEQFHMTGNAQTTNYQRTRSIDQTIQETQKVWKRYATNDTSKQMEDNETDWEIYRALQTPHDNPIMNALYLHEKIQQPTREEARIPAAYFSKLLLLRAKLDKELERLNGNMDKYNTYDVGHLVRFSKTTEGQAAKQALLQREFKQFKHTDEFRNILIQVCIRNKTTNNTRNTINNQTRTTRTGKPVSCHACGNEEREYLQQKITQRIRISKHNWRPLATSPEEPDQTYNTLPFTYRDTRTTQARRISVQQKEYSDTSNKPKAKRQEEIRKNLSLAGICGRRPRWRPRQTKINDWIYHTDVRCTHYHEIQNPTNDGQKFHKR